MTWNVVYVGIFGRSACPMKIAKVATSLYRAAYVRLLTKHRNHYRIVFACKIYYAHNTRSTNYAHILLYTIGRTSVYGYEVVGLVKRRAYHLCRYCLETLHHIVLHTLYQRGVLAGLAHLFCKHCHLSFLVEIALGKLSVNVGKLEILRYSRVPLKHLATNGISRRKPYTALLAIVMEKQSKACHFEQ